MPFNQLSHFGIKKNEMCFVREDYQNE